MINLNDENISYILASSESQLESNKLCNILYSKGYSIISITGYQNGVYDKSYIAISESDNDQLRMDAIYLNEEFQKKYTLVKYKNENTAKRVNQDGSENLMDILLYESDNSNKIYICDGISFSFKEKQRYFFPSSKSQLKSGMIVEFFNNEKWKERIILNLENEYDKMYKLLMKYNKLRVKL